MRELEKVTMESSKQSKSPGQIDTSSNTSLHSPVLSPSSTSGSYFSSEPTDDSSLPSSGNEVNNGSNPVVNKAVEDWIAKARESLHEFGAFIGIGGAAMPKSYLVHEDFEGDSSEEDDFVDVQEEFSDDFGNGEDQYGLAVQDPDGEDVTQTNDPSRGRLRHKGSDSSIGTVGTTSTNAMRAMRKNPSENSKPANLPVEAAPFGLFGNLALKTPRSRGTSRERDDEDKGPGIANANFFKSSKLSFVSNSLLVLNRTHSYSSSCSWPETGDCSTSSTCYPYSWHYHPSRSREAFQDVCFILYIAVRTKLIFVLFSAISTT